MVVDSNSVICESIVSRFHEIVCKYSSRTALKYLDREYTYDELDNITDRFAAVVKKSGILKGEKIAVYMDHTDIYVCSILSILKCGCVYVPIDMNYPIERIKNILGINQIKKVICNDCILDIDEVEVIPYDIVYQKQYSKEKEGTILCVDDTAYVIFTSGSTGVPKGIEIKHRSVLNLVNSFVPYFEKEQVHNVLLLAPFIFDMSVGQMFFALLTGQTLDVLPIDIKESVEELVMYMSHRHITICDITPLHLNSIIEYLDSSNKPEKNFHMPEIIISSGEALPLQIAKKLFQCKEFKRSLLLNCYGPAEACVYVTIYQITERNIKNIQKMLIGKPINNTKIFILNEDGLECKVDEIGELYISGEGLAKGYVNQKELTDKYFVTKGEVCQDILYRTGDFGYFTEDGNICYTGRNGDQVKIHGYRIELGEIQFHIANLGPVKECKVLAVDSKQGKKIVAYYISGEKISLEYFMDSLKKVLPHYMIPNYFVEVERFDLTPNGKLNKKNLPDYRICYLRPKNVQEDNMVIHDNILFEILNICKRILKIENINYNDSFIMLGGNSLLFFSLSMEIQKKWNVAVKLSELYTEETIISIANIVQDKIKKKREQINYLFEYEQKKTTLAESIPFQRLIFLEEKKGNLIRDKYKLHNFPTYNVMYRIILDEYIESELLEKSLDAVIKAEDIFRISFEKAEKLWNMKLNEGEVYQYFECRKCKDINNIDDLKSYGKDFNILELPLFQIILFIDNNSKQCIMINFHHAIFDYFSAHIFLKQVFYYYYKQEIIHKIKNFMDYSVYINNIDKNNLGKFWNEYYKGRESALLIPGDIEKNRLRKMIFFKEKEIILSGEDLKLMRNICKKYSFTEYLFTFNCFAILLSYILRKNDIVLGTYINMRSLGNEFETQMIGLITNMVGIRFQYEGNMSILDSIFKLKDNFLKILNYLPIYFNEVFQYFDEEELMKGQLYEIIFNYIIQGSFDIAETKHRFQITEIGEEPCSIPFTIKAYEDDEKILFKFKYCSQIYSDLFITKLAEKYMKIIHECIYDINQSIKIYNDECIISDF